MDKTLNEILTGTGNIYDDGYLSTKNLFLNCFNQLPQVMYISAIDGEKAFNIFKEQYKNQIRSVHEERYYKAIKRKGGFNKALIILSTNCILEFDDDCCEILHDGSDAVFIDTLRAEIAKIKQPQRRQPFEINLIIHSRGSFDLKAMEVKKTNLNLDLYYEDDFKPVDEVIRKQLSKKNNKGIVLLHGLPGTGKTTYLRYLIGRIKKRVLFLSPDAASHLMAPEFMQLLIDNPNTVIVIEDAENVIMDRRMNNSSSVSNLLNISDGLLADFLNVQLICTFNSALSTIDSALLREGRLIAQYEFGKLSAEKGQRLSDKLGYDRLIANPMTIAEITNQQEKVVVKRARPVLGFRREAIVA